MANLQGYPCKLLHMSLHLRHNKYLRITLDSAKGPNKTVQVFSMIHQHNNMMFFLLHSSPRGLEGQHLAGHTA